MVEETKPKDVAARYDGHVAELREFFASRSVRFGEPGDVVQFAALVAQPDSFADEMGSMLRSILYQEDERLSREDLLALVTLAVGNSPLPRELPGLDDALRQLFRFVNAAMRQSGGVIPPEMAAEPARTDQDHAAGRDQALGANIPQEPVLRPREPLSAGTSLDGAFRSASTAESVLFRAVTMAAAETEEDGGTIEKSEVPVPFATSVNAPPRASAVPVRRRRGNTWLVSAGAFAAAAGVLVYLLWPALTHLVGTRQRGAAMSASAGAAAPAATRVCVHPADAGISPAALEERSFVAHTLLDQEMYGAALQQLHAIALADPGFPGVHLDESAALLHTGQPERAREAIDAQIGISECLAGLPGASLDAYCATQFSPSTISGCRPQLAHIQQAAELQAALVHLELGHRIDAGDSAAAAMKQLQQDDAKAVSKGKSAGVARMSVPVRAGQH